jgi:hypothetical protein
MGPIIGSEAIASGQITRGQLRWNYVAVHPDVYLQRNHRASLLDHARAAWLWTGRRGIVAGLAAARLHGVRAIPDSVDIELISRPARPQPGIVVRQERIADDEVTNFGEMAITSRARTALDLARRLPRDDAVPILDEIIGRGAVVDEVLELAKRYPRARGLPQALLTLPQVDGGTRCPEESLLRLALLDAGFPRPRTRIVLGDRLGGTELGMGWDDVKVGLSFEREPTEASAVNPYGILQDVMHEDTVARLGWMELRVVAGHTRYSVIHRVRAAFKSRGR